MPEDTNDREPDLAGALPFFQSSQRDDGEYSTDPQIVSDLIKMEQLRLSFDRLASCSSEKPEPDDVIPFTRSNVIALLSGIHNALGENFRRPVSQPEDIVVAFDHPAITLLSDLIGVFKDLDNAKTHPIFETPETSKGAALTTAEVERRDALLELVDVVKFCEGFSSRAQAERWLEQRMTRTIGRKNAIKATQLKEMRKTRRRQQRRTS